MIKPNVLHICPDFPNTRLYNLLISHLVKYQQNKVYVPASAKEIQTDYPVFWTGADFGILDRLLFFRKQYIIKEHIEKLGLCNECNIIHAHNLFSAGFSARKLSQKHNIPYIVAVRNTDVNTFFQYMIHLRHTGIQIMLDASAVVFISPAYKKNVFEKYIPKRYKDYLEKKCYVIPNGIDNYFLEQRPSLPKQLLSKNIIRLIYVGEINKNKNITTTIKACELLERKGFKPMLNVVGPITNSRLDYIKNNRFVNYHPKCSKEGVLSYLRESDIFVMPSKTETFGLVYIEAMSQGLPIIYSINQGIDGYFKEGEVGFHVKSSCANAIAENVEKIIKNYSIMSSACIEKAQSFSWDKIAETYNELYIKCTNL